jgi:hypothetical protein
MRKVRTRVRAKGKSEKALYMQLQGLGAPLALHGLPLLAALP